ncbi:Na+/Picotransporter [Methylocella silvestris BL2]|uniref:Na+/Picotransporter n=1 Tax=Methylocella silvestris (strain DSM 15510 / CIP 108128 / LMG 27833 / NCIMB 13906 / BL2) TaxID=395965 RepID=B8EIP2_METSB|nr:Na/Pi symporter [Methylocella silvestris]ACK51859.1 Na+/Picotransporter [Methylocella silvestris BL2]
MATAITVLGGVGLFLLGMTVMTDGLKAMAGSALRTVLGKAAATPLSGVAWGAIITLLVQSSSATTMTTIGLVSAGLLTFPQGLGLVFGANVGTTGTGWLVALIGLRVSLSSYALPMIFIGALTKLLGGGRIAAAGAALAGFALVLYGLATLQQGMGGLAERLHPSDLPAVIGAPGVGLIAGWSGLLTLVAVGLAMTAVMQSSTAAIAVTLAAFGAGAISLDQGCALIIGQNIGTATSSALAAIGASVMAKRLALAYVLFKLIAALFALAAFPLAMPLMQGWQSWVDGLTLLAAYHTAYNVVGVGVLLPAIGWFTRIVERLLPDKASPIERGLDPAALVNPVVAVEAARRAIASVLQGLSASVEASLLGGKRLDDLVDGSERVLEKAREFLSELKTPPASEEEQQRLTSTLHALDHASRLAELAAECVAARPAKGDPDALLAAQLCAAAMRSVGTIADEITDESALSSHAEPIGWGVSPEAEEALAELEGATKALGVLQRAYRTETLAAVTPGRLTAVEAFARVDAARRLDVLTHHGWLSAAYLLGRGE